jgi:hypothetical protein
MQPNNRVAALELERPLGVRYKAAGRLKPRLMEVMSEREADRRLGERVEVDNARLGGIHPDKVGRGAEGKVLAAAAAGVGAHKRVIVGTRTNSDLPCFQWINTLLGNIKRSIEGTYHGFKFDTYAAPYLAELQYHFNRRLNLPRMVSHLLGACALTTTRPEKRLSKAIACSLSLH